MEGGLSNQHNNFQIIFIPFQVDDIFLPLGLVDVCRVKV